MTTSYSQGQKPHEQSTSTAHGIVSWPKTEARSLDAVDSLTADSAAPREIPDATVARLPIYLRALSTLTESGQETVSSSDLAKVAGVNSAKLRKDLSYLGSYGTRGVGYEVGYLFRQISTAIGLSQDWRVVIIGMGNLGKALSAYAGFATRGFRVVGLFDADPMVIGEEFNQLIVQDISKLERVIEQTGASIAVLTVPSHAAQGICDRVVTSGIGSILNFAPCVLNVPDSVQLRKVDLATELQILAFHANRTEEGHDVLHDQAPQTGSAIGKVVNQ